MEYRRSPPSVRSAQYAIRNMLYTIYLPSLHPVIQSPLRTTHMPTDNILFILTDQWPAWAFSFMGADIPTPNIDRLAAQGTVFANAFTTCPLCTPARGALLTSRWPHQTGIYDNYNVGHSQQSTLSMDEDTWIDTAVRRGFHTGYFGKWHLG
ncbi:MAG: hypothetical protein E4H27_09200, partial [Anaerolineales bacterium]